MSQNFEVKGEVQDCDVLAVRSDGPPVVVELNKLVIVPEFPSITIHHHLVNLQRTF